MKKKIAHIISCVLLSMLLASVCYAWSANWKCTKCGTTTSTTNCEPPSYWQCSKGGGHTWQIIKRW